MANIEMISGGQLQVSAESRGSSWFKRVDQSMQARLETGGGPKPFHKVPPEVRRANPTDYDPMFFTFGPCHAKFDVPPPSYDLLKVKIAQALTSQQSFNHLRCAIEMRDGDIRKIYEEYLWELQFDIEPQVLAYLLALDALTIVAGALYPSKLDARGLGPAIWRDAMLLEQQLPLFILQAAIDSLAILPDRGALLELLDPPTDTSSPEYIELYRRALVDPSSPLFMRAVVGFYAVSVSYPFVSEAKKWKWQDPSNHEQSMLSHIYHTVLSLQRPIGTEAVVINVKHEMPQIAAAQGAGNRHHCCRLNPLELLCCAQISQPQFPRIRIPTASELRRCGIHFKAGDGGFTGIKFNAATRVVTLPEIWVSEESKTYLLNLAVQEGMMSLNQSPVTSYIQMMDDLIDTEEDVKLLVDEDVIHNMFGSNEELAEMWANLADNLPTRYTRNDRMVIRYVSEVSRQCWGNYVSDASHLCWSNCWAGFRDTYCDKKPWLLISVIAAFCLFVLTILQTTYTILQYNNQIT